MGNKSFISKIKEADTLVRVSFFSNIVLYLIVTMLSTIHSIDIFTIFNIGATLAIVTAIAFEIGQVVSLLSLSMLDLTNKFKARFLFYLLTTVQVIGNLYHATAAQLHNFVDGKPIESIPDYLIPLSTFIETISFGLLKSGSETLQYIGTILLIILNGSLPIIALLFIENSISFLTKDNTKTDKIIETKIESKVESDYLDFLDTQKDDNEKIIIDNIVDNEIVTNEDIKIINEPIIDTIKVPDIIDTKTDDLQVDNTIENTQISEIIEDAKVLPDQPAPDNKKTKFVRMKVIEGKDKYTFKDIDKDKLPTF